MGKREALAKKMAARRKSVPKMYLNGDNRVLIFDDKPEVLFSAAALADLRSSSELKDGVYHTHLLTVEVVDGKATVRFGKAE